MQNLRGIDSIDAEKFCHEMNTPLSVIMLEMELMAYCLDDKTKLRELIETATHSAYRLARMVGNLQDIFRIDAGDSMINLTEVDAVAFVREICACAEPYARAKSIRLVCEASQNEIVMPMDIEKSQKLLFNLLSNAIKFTGDHGEIAVRIQDDHGEGIFVSVADTGDGIPEDRRRLMFDGSAGKAKSGGIGLTLAKLLAEMLGGRITAKSEVGKGSEFTVRLPRVRVSDAKINVYGFNLDKKTKIEFSDLNAARAEAPVEAGSPV